MIVPRYYENLSVLHENTMPARAYYIPSSKRMDNLVEHREESDRMQLLNGTWKFQYFNSIYEDVYKRQVGLFAYATKETGGIAEFGRFRYF